MQKKRLDIFLVERECFSSRAKAQAAVLEGKVFIDGVKEEKAGKLVSQDVSVEIKREKIPYVSRGAVKLKKALDSFKIDVKGKVVLDVGAGTGGFTDLLLKAGAEEIIAVDVGYGQFNWTLRNNSRVCLLERTNIRYLKAEHLPKLAELAVVDLSFISIKKVIDNLRRLLVKGSELVVLFKPQFEVGRKLVGKGGVVREKKVHIEALEDMWSYLENEDVVVKGLAFSPILGTHGNIEFLFYLCLDGKKSASHAEIERKVAREVDKAYEVLGVKRKKG